MLWGPRFGAFFALLFSGMGILAVTLTWLTEGRRSWTWPDVGLALMVNCVGSLAGGAIVGARRRRNRHRGGAVVTGALVGATFMALGFASSAGPRVLLRPAGWIAAATFGVPCGAICGWWTWRRFARRP